MRFLPPDLSAPRNICSILQIGKLRQRTLKENMQRCKISLVDFLASVWRIGRTWAFWFFCKKLGEWVVVGFVFEVESLPRLEDK